MRWMRNGGCHRERGTRKEGEVRVKQINTWALGVIALRDEWGGGHIREHRKTTLPPEQLANDLESNESPPPRQRLS